MHFGLTGFARQRRRQPGERAHARKCQKVCLVVLTGSRSTHERKRETPGDISIGLDWLAAISRECRERRNEDVQVCGRSGTCVFAPVREVQCCAPEKLPATPPPFTSARLPSSTSRAAFTLSRQQVTTVRRETLTSEPPGGNLDFLRETL